MLCGLHSMESTAESRIRHTLIYNLDLLTQKFNLSKVQPLLLAGWSEKFRAWFSISCSFRWFLLNSLEKSKLFELLAVRILLRLRENLTENLSMFIRFHSMKFILVAESSRDENSLHTELLIKTSRFPMLPMLFKSFHRTLRIPKAGETLLKSVTNPLRSI